VEAAFEVGAHAAEFSKGLRAIRPNIPIFAFEANTHVYEKFKQTIPTSIRYENIAVGADTSPKQFHILKTSPIAGQKVEFTDVNPASGLKRRVSADATYLTVECPCTTLDLLHDSAPKPSALWIDVEGASGDVLVGGWRALLSFVQCAMIEVEERKFWEGQWLANDVREFMARLGFVNVARDLETEHQYNCIFIRQEREDDAMVAVSNYADYLLNHCTA
jgi:FkbM family methyltransferase